MFSTYGVHEAVSEQLDNAGYHCIEVVANAVNFKNQIRFFKENPWKSAHLFRKKITKTRKMLPILECLDIMGESETRSMVRLFYTLTSRAAGATRFNYMANTRNELDRYYPWVVPIARDLGMEFQPMICYYPPPQYR